MMRELTINETYEVTGGESLTSQMINAISKAIGTIFDFGRAVGGSIRRVISGELCPLT